MYEECYHYYQVLLKPPIPTYSIYFPLSRSHEDFQQVALMLYPVPTKWHTASKLLLPALNTLK